MYELIFTDTAEKQFNKLSKDIQTRIGSALERIKVKPHKHIKRLIKSKYFRLRVDNYRIILDVRDTALIITVIELGPRANVYK